MHLDPWHLDDDRGRNSARARAKIYDPQPLSRLRRVLALHAFEHVNRIPCNHLSLRTRREDARTHHELGGAEVRDAGQMLERYALSPACHQVIEPRWHRLLKVLPKTNSLGAQQMRCQQLGVYPG